MITVVGLHKQYGNIQVLKNINLTMNPGEVHGVVGENGAGKTTLFKCIAGLETYQGSVCFDRGTIREVTGFLETNPFFISKITGKEYLQLLCNARAIALDNIKNKNIFDLPLGQYASTYSTGMKKKLALTGILLQQNDIFILDEPFSGVDIQSNILISEVITKLKSLQKIIILSSHTFSALSDHCDYLHYLKSGTIAKSLPKEQFEIIEDEMKSSGIGSRIDQLGLI